MKIVLSLVLLMFSLFAKTNYNSEYDFLEISKNYLKTQSVQKKRSDVNRALESLNNINFAMKPYITPVKPFDSLKIHYAYPLKIFLPKGTTVTSASLSNSKLQPEISQNIVKVTVDNNFESGLLDIVYIVNTDTKNGKYMSIKLDKYIYDYNNSDVLRDKLYTQAQYYFPHKLSNQEVLAKLKTTDYNKSFNQIEYMGVVYDIYLVNVVENMKVIKKLKDKKYINASLLYKNREFNYLVITNGI